MGAIKELSLFAMNFSLLVVIFFSEIHYRHFTILPKLDKFNRQLQINNYMLLIDNAGPSKVLSGSEVTLKAHTGGRNI